MNKTAQQQAAVINRNVWGSAQSNEVGTNAVGGRQMLNAQADTDGEHFDTRLAKTLIPIKSMTESHLNELINNSKIEIVFRGQTLFEQGAYDRQSIFLLHGDVELIYSNGEREVIKSSENFCPIANEQPRACRAVAMTDCSVLRVDSEYLDKMLCWSQIAEYLLLDISYQRDLDEDADWMMTILKSNLFFKVPPTNAQLIFDRIQPMMVEAGDAIVRQGEIGDNCYFIKHGAAEVRQSLDDRSPPVKVAEIAAGRCFGELALVNETVRNASVIMKTDGVLMVLSKRNFLKLMKEPKVEVVDGQATQSMLDEGAVCIDVRTEEEYSKGHIEKAINIPLNLLRIKTRMLDKNTRYVLYCDTGRRSRAAAYLLKQGGFDVSALGAGTRGLRGGSHLRLVHGAADYLIKGGHIVAGA